MRHLKGEIGVVSKADGYVMLCYVTNSEPATLIFIYLFFVLIMMFELTMTDPLFLRWETHEL